MSLTGGISFFRENYAAYALGVRAVASSNDANANLILGRDDFFRWESSGSDDTIQETLTITLPQPQTISRIFILGHNFKDFDISVDGVSITGLNSGFNEHNGGSAPLATLSGGDIDQNDYDGDVSYYEFDELEASEVVITCLTTQVADAQKMASRVILTSEIGTLRGFPDMSGIKINPNEKIEKTILGYSHIQRGIDTADFDLNLRAYPYQEDLDLLDSLYERDEPFFVWLCGGLPDQFRLNVRGWRAQDVYQMKLRGSLKNGFYKGVYIRGAQLKYSFREVIS